MAENRIAKAKLTVKDLGNPRLVDDKKQRVILGTIIGIAMGVKTKLDAKGEAFEAITGAFKGTRHDDSEVIESGILYLPAGFHDQIVAELRSEGVTAVQFAYEVAAVYASNPIGYSYAFRPLLKQRTGSPLDALETEIAANQRPALEHKQAEPEAKKSSK